MFRDCRPGFATGYLDYGPLEELKIDGRPAWGWLETQYYKEKLASLEYKAVVPYDDIMYTVEFFTGRDEFMDEAFLRESVCRFEIGRTKVNEAAVTAGFAMALGFVGLLMFLNRGDGKKR